MAKKFSELNALEMMSALASLAEPVGHLAEDEVLWSAFQDCTLQALKMKRNERVRIGLMAYAKLVPILLNEEHKRDTLAIVSIIEGRPARELAELDGAEFIADLREAWQSELKGFFIKSGLLAQTESSSR